MLLSVVCFSSFRYQRQVAEGAFRFVHGRVRTFAESIVFYRGEGKEARDLEFLFSKAISAGRAWIRANVPYLIFLACFTGGDRA